MQNALCQVDAVHELRMWLYSASMKEISTAKESRRSGKQVCNVISSLFHLDTHKNADRIALLCHSNLETEHPRCCGLLF